MIKLIYDSYVWNNKRKVLTEKELKISGLEMIGYSREKENKVPLQDHIHSSTEIVFVVMGRQIYCMNEQEYVVTANQAFITPAYTLHGTGSVMHGRHEIYWLRVDTSVEDSFLMLDKESGEVLRQRLSLLPFSKVSLTTDSLHLIERSFLLLSDEDRLLRVEGCSLLVQFLCKILKASEEGKSLSKQLSDVVEYIDQHISDFITLEELAVVGGFSLSRFKSRFTQELRITPREYINMKKIERAKELLVGTDTDIIDIAFSLSFSSSSYFSALFRKLEGCTPSQFRQKEKNKI